MATDRLLMMFVRNPLMGMVKTRLAKSVGDEKALQVYNVMLDHTMTIAKRVHAEKVVFFSNKIENKAMWRKPGFTQLVQEGNDLGERMYHAFRYAFSKQYAKVVIIGSDCLDLNEHILNEAYAILETHEVVIGPATDGGYYLLGMRKLYKELFFQKQWSTENVLLDTLLDLSALDVSMKLLPTLSDIDEEKDLEPHQHLFKN